MTIGEKLKRARKKLNFDLDDVARETKIAKMFLIAIEKDDVSALPGGVYTRNFLRTYAQFLELDPDIITAEFHDQFDIKPHFVLQQEQTKRDDSAFKQQRRQLLLIIGVILLVAIIAMVLLYQPWRSRTPVGVKSVPAATTQTPSPVMGQMTDVDRQNTPESAALALEPEPPATADVVDEVGASGTPEDGGGPDPVATTATEDDAPPRGAAQAPPLSDGLPLASLDGENVLAPSGAVGAAGLDDVIVIEALRDVRIEVYIDGEMLTNRRLPAGQRRIYRMGRLHVVKIWNIADVAIQSGDGVYRAPNGVRGSVLIEDFKPGEVLARLASAEVLPLEQEP